MASKPRDYEKTGPHPAAAGRTGRGLVGHGLVDCLSREIAIECGKEHVRVQQADSVFAPGKDTARATDRGFGNRGRWFALFVVMNSQDAMHFAHWKDQSVAVPVRHQQALKGSPESRVPSPQS